MGTRLRPLTNSIPKCLVAVHRHPLLDYWLALLFDAGFERVLINTHWLAQAVRDHVAASPWRESIDLVDEPELLGTGGTKFSPTGAISASGPSWSPMPTISPISTSTSSSRRMTIVPRVAR